MADILSAEEIEVLLSSLAPLEGGGLNDPPGQTRAPTHSIRQASGPPRSKRPNATDYEAYDFKRPDKLSKEQLRTLHNMHETCARLAASNLSALLRTPTQVQLTSIEQIPFEEFLKGVGPSALGIASLSPLAGQAIIEVEFQMVFSMVDRMLGGPGRSVPRTSLTDIERPLVAQLMERCLAALKAAWEPVVVIEPRVETIETSAQFAQIAPPTDIVLMVLFELRVGDLRGAMSFCVPYLVLKPIASKLAGQRWAGIAGRKKSATQRGQVAQHIAKTKLPCTVRLGTAMLPMREFVQLEVGDIIRLDQTKAEELLVEVKGKPKFTAKPVRWGQKLAVQVSGKYSA